MSHRNNVPLWWLLTWDTNGSGGLAKHFAWSFTTATCFASGPAGAEAVPAILA
jgi:hypothetical protein